LLNFHGPEDLVVPYDSDVLYLLGTIPVTEVDGSYAVAQKAEQLGLTHCFEVYEGQGHTPHVSNEAYYDTTRSIISNFLSHLVCPEIELDCNYREISTHIETKLQTTLRIWPNPAQGSARLEVPGNLRGAEMVLRNSTGQMVRRWRADQMVMSLDFTGLPAGIYSIHVKDHPLTTRLVLTGQ
jgi:hypothetical protein